MTREPAVPPQQFGDVRRGTQLVPFWNAVGINLYLSGHDYVTEADLLAGLFEIVGSILIKILADDGRDVAAARLTIMDIVAFAPYGGPLRGALTPGGRRVIQAASEEAQARRDAQRPEYVLLALLREGTSEVKGMLAAFGIDRERVLRELPPLPPSTE
jgi:ATP-dependent Clp protease ATP-binding subunit ClpA